MMQGSNYLIGKNTKLTLLVQFSSSQLCPPFHAHDTQMLPVSTLSIMWLKTTLKKKSHFNNVKLKFGLDGSCFVTDEERHAHTTQMSGSGRQGQRPPV